MVAGLALGAAVAHAGGGEVEGVEAVLGLEAAVGCLDFDGGGGFLKWWLEG